MALLIARSAITYKGNLPPEFELWKADFETGDTSQFTGAGVGTITVHNDGQAYQGLYYARARLANGQSNNNNDVHDIGTPGTLSTQRREFWFQLRTAFDTWSGNVGGDLQKIFQFNLYDSTWNGGSFADSNKKFQITIGIAGQSLPQHRQFVVRLVEYLNESTGVASQIVYLTQNASSVQPTIGPWDTLRMRVVFDNDGDATLGIGHGNGIVKVWCNNTVIIDYNTVNLIRGNPLVGLGRLMVLSEVVGGVWVAGNTHMYWDNIQLATTQNKLDAMPSTAIARGGEFMATRKIITPPARDRKLILEQFGCINRPVV